MLMKNFGESVGKKNPQTSAHCPSRPPARNVQHRLQESDMHEEAAGRELPTVEDPGERFPAVTVGAGELLRSRTGAPGQQLGRGNASERGNRCFKRGTSIEEIIQKIC